MKVIYIKATLFILALVCMGVFVYLCNTHISEMDVTVLRTEMQQYVSNDSNGNVSTDNYMMVYTDKGTYRVEQDGYWARPQFIGILKEGKKSHIKVVGFECKFLGIYRDIIEVR